LVVTGETLLAFLIEQLERMIVHIILIISLIAAIASIYVIYHVQNKPSEAPALPEVPGLVAPVRRSKDASNNDVSGTALPPFATDQIQSLDDYEYNMIFENEGDTGMTKKTRDLLMSQYPMDWTVQPPSSSIFQQGLASYKSKEHFTDTPTSAKNPYMTIDRDMNPPVYKDEKDILATYTPKKPNELTTYDAEDAKEIIDKIYSAKGLVANYKQTGANTFTVMTTRPKDEKVVYEDEVAPAAATAATASTQAVPSNGETVANTIDPFFTVNANSSREGKWDYTSWTPGLERMFAPTEPQMNWY